MTLVSVLLLKKKKILKMICKSLSSGLTEISAISLLFHNDFV